MILEVKEINTFYGTSHILFDVSMSVDRGEIVCLLGRNGAGKTTTMRSIMGSMVRRCGADLPISSRKRGWAMCPTTD
jgi:branched-chain amino acid transport system ATP-binding protein